MNEVFSWIGSIGFPAAVCIYLLVKIKPAIESLEKTVLNNTYVIEKLCKKLNEKGDNNG